MNRKILLTLARRFAPKLYAAKRLVELDDIEVQCKRAHALMRIEPDERARLGVTYNGLTFRNHDNGSVYGDVGPVIRDPYMDKLDAIYRMLIAAGPGGAQKATEMLPAENIAPVLPEHVPLRSLVTTCSYHDLALGVSAAGVVRGDLGDLVHIAVGGSSGWGKSVFLRMLAYQLALSVEHIDLVLLDLENTTLSPFAKCDRLLYPIIDNEHDTIAIFDDLLDELNRRRELFRQHPGVDSLQQYNALADEKISPLVLLGDEITALLADKKVEAKLRTLALRARKYGMWLVLAGQDWRAVSLDPAIRNQLSCCVQFKAKSGPQSRVLLECSDARDLTIKGRALAWLPGRELIEMQSPIIGHQDIIAAMSGTGPQRAVPVPSGDGLEAQVIDVWDNMDRPNITAVCREIFDGQSGGANWERVKAIVYSTGRL